jgi:hypothetical protein
VQFGDAVRQEMIRAKNKSRNTLSTTLPTEQYGALNARKHKNIFELMIRSRDLK